MKVEADIVGLVQTVEHWEALQAHDFDAVTFREGNACFDISHGSMYMGLTSMMHGEGLYKMSGSA